MECLAGDSGTRQLLEVARSAALAAGASPADADDAASTAVENLLKRWDNPTVTAVRKRGGPAWRKYVASTGRHAFYDMVRSRERRRARELRVQDNQRSTHPTDRPGVIRPPTNDPTDVDRYISRLETIEALNQAGLSPQQLQIMSLHLIYGMDNASIASALQTSGQMVRKQKRLAIRKLIHWLLTEEEASEHPQ